MRKFLPGLVAGVSIALLWSCGNPSLLVPEIQTTSPVTINTVSPGTLVSASDTIPVQLAYSSTYRSDGKTPDSLEIHLYSSTQEELRTYVLGPDQLSSNDSFTLDLPDLPDGLYTLSLTLYGQGKVLDQKSVQFFHVSGNYAVNAISVYPSSLFPGSDGLLQAHVDSPSGSDPYLRWSLNGRVVAEGPLSEGTDQVTVRAPDVEGAYNVVLELFPMSPLSGTSFPFDSSIKQNTELFVSATQQLSDNDLGPEDSYYSLFHFKGNLRDSGIRTTLPQSSRSASAAPAVPIGSPTLQANGSIFGYRLDGTDGFRIGQVLLPFTATTLSPFSFSVRGMATGLNGVQNLFSAQSADGSFGFSVGVLPDGSATATLQSNGVTATTQSDSPIFANGTPVLFSVSVTPGQSSTRIAWYKSGTFVSEVDVPVAFPGSAYGGAGAAGAASAGGGSQTGSSSQTKQVAGAVANMKIVPGTTTIGGTGGFIGILDELGVYFRDPSDRPATDNQLFSHAMAEAYGDSVVYAQGFEGVSLPEGVVASGPVTVGAGTLSLSPGSSVLFPRFLFDQDTLLVALQLDAASAASAGTGGAGSNAAGGTIAFGVVSAASGAGGNSGNGTTTASMGSSASGGDPQSISAGQPLFGALFTVDTSGSVSVPAGSLIALRRGGVSYPVESLTPGMDGRIRLPVQSLTPTPLEIAITQQEQELAVDVGDMELVLRLPSASFDGVRMSVSESLSRTTSFRIHSVLARTEGSGLTDKLRTLLGSSAGKD